jgi:hypothetical protein
VLNVGVVGDVPVELDPHADSENVETIESTRSQ